MSERASSSNTSNNTLSEKKLSSSKNTRKTLSQSRPRTNNANITREVEALLFSVGRAVSEDALASILDCDPKHIKKALATLKQEYEEKDTALKIYNEEQQWKMLVRDQYIPIVQKVVADTELSRATLETLAIIAYGSPVLQSDVIERRGSTAYEHIKELEHAGFVTKQPEGRSFTLKITEKFFEYFDVEGHDDIRALFKDIKAPEKQQTLGDLQVVDVLPEDEKQQKEPIDVPHTYDPFADNPFMKRELGTRPQVTEEERAVEENFLDDLDKKINAISSKNDSHEKDESLRLRPDAQASDFNDAPEQNDESSSHDADDENENSSQKSSNDKKSALDEALDLEQL